MLPSSGSLTLAPSSGVVAVTGASGTLEFSGSGTVSSGGGGDIVLVPGTGVINVASSTLNFNQTASITSPGVLTVASTGLLNLRSFANQVNVTGNVLSFNQDTTIESLGTLTLAPTSLTIAFTNDITMEPATGTNFVISNSGANTGVVLQRGGSSFGVLLLSNHHLVYSGPPPTIHYTEISPQYTVTLTPNSTDMVGGFTIVSSFPTAFDFQLIYSQPYSANTTFVIFSAANEESGFLLGGDKMGVSGFPTHVEFFGKFASDSGGTRAHTYMAIGAF